MPVISAELPDVEPDDPAAKRLAREIRAARAYADMSKEQIAQAVGVSEWTIGRWENGIWKRPIGRARLEAIARATEFPQAYLDAGFLAPEPKAGESIARAARRSQGRQQNGQGEGPQAPPEEDQEP